MRRMMTGTAIVLVTAGIMISILSEILTAYDESSRIAYAAGMITCAVILIPGIILIYQAFHFEKIIFGRDRESYDELMQDLTKEDILSTDSLILTDRFLMMQSQKIFRMANIVPVSRIIACFEAHGSGSEDKTADYSLCFYDEQFRLYPVLIKARSKETGQEIRSRLCTKQPWIFHTEEEQKSFDMWKITPAGKKSILSRLERRKDKANA